MCVCEKSEFKVRTLTHFSHVALWMTLLTFAGNLSLEETLCLLIYKKCDQQNVDLKNVICVFIKISKKTPNMDKQNKQ